MKEITLIPSPLSVPLEQNTMLSIFFLLFLVFLSIFILLRKTKLFLIYLGGFYSFSKLNRFVEEQQQSKFILSFPFLTIALNFFLTGVIIYWFLWSYIDPDDYILSCLLIVALINGLPYLHHYAIHLTGITLKLPQYAEKHNLIAHYTLHLSAFLSIPLFFYFLNARTLNIEFIQIYILVSTSIICVYYLVRSFILLYKPSLVAWFYIFIYLCTLEVIPFILIFKVITEAFS